MSNLKMVLKEGRRELILSGKETSRDIEENGLDPSLFSAKQLNYLSINNTKLKILPPGIGQLCNVVTLVLHTNCLTQLPLQIGELKNLKHLDVSKNSLVELPTEISSLKEIVTLNVSFNQLTEFPSLKSNKKLQFLDLSYNKLEIFPDILYSDLNVLAELKLDGNKIKCIPASLRLLTSLRSLSVRNNLLCNVPVEVGNLKLKDVKFDGNIFSDKNLKKTIIGGNTKKILEYIRKHGVATASAEEMHKKDSEACVATCDTKETTKDNNHLDVDIISDEAQRTRSDYLTQHIRLEQNPAAVVTRMEGAVEQRRYILGCVIKNIEFNISSFNTFLRIQNVIHRHNCGDRNLAAIGTHDYDLLSCKSMIYTSKDPNDIFFTPLGSTRKICAAKYFAEQKSKAETLNKRKKNSSGILKYVHMLEGLQRFPCLMTEDETQVISLPPVTNCESSKISLSTTNIFIEITSQHSLLQCKTVMESLIRESFTCGIFDHDNEDGSGITRVLHLAPVVINDSDGSFYIQFPPKGDVKNFPDNVKITYIC